MSTPSTRCATPTTCASCWRSSNSTPRHSRGQTRSTRCYALCTNRVKAAKAIGEEWLDPWVLAGYRAAYEQIIALGHHQNQPPTVRTGKRGPIGRSPSANLLRRLDEQREQVLRFAHDFQVPFDNNLLERDIRMIKIQQKISGSWRTTTGAERFFALRAYISTTRKQRHDILDALARHTPWLPAAASP